jgi:hypothetical protein
MEWVLFDVEAGARYVITEKTVRGGEAMKQSTAQTTAPLSGKILRRGNQQNRLIKR